MQMTADTLRCRAQAAVFCLGLALSSTSLGQSVRFNELMSANATALADKDGDFSDWFELYNGTAQAVDLTGYGLSDDGLELRKWIVPSLTLQPEEHRVIYASGKDIAGFGGTWDGVVSKGDLWRYRPGFSEPPRAWTDSGFDVSSWFEGPTGIGYGDGDDATLIAPTLSVYARIVFEVADPAAVAKAILHMDYDDGFVAYLNGTEIARSNLGQAGVRPTYDQTATTFTEPRSVRGLSPQPFSVAAAASLLQSGENVLAVQVHNSSSGSSDLSCIPYLTLGFRTTTGTPRPPADEISDDLSREIHTNFRLSAQGEALYLTDTSGRSVDSVRFGAVRSDVSLGRQPDGTGEWFFFDTPTPGAANTTEAYHDIATPPIFSHLGGRYGAPLAITLTGPAGEEIYISTDGSTPDPGSTRYVSPVSIDRTTVLRARTAGAGVLPSEVFTHTYVLNENANLPIVSISTDPALLWDNDTGIYAFPPEDQAACPSFPHFCANFWEDREIGVHLELFELGGPVALNAGAGATIVGGWSRAFPQKSLGLFARGRYGSPEFNHRLFPRRPYGSYQSFLLRNSGNDWDATMLRDGFMQELVTEADVDRMEYRPSVLYLNGEYWGIPNIREKINEHYAAALGDTGPDDVDIIGLDTDQPAGDPEIIGGDAEHYELMLAFVGSADMQTAHALETVGSMMDVDSFIDYMITQIFVGNTDWPGNNVKLWRPRTADGRWRWILFDLDFGFGRWNPEDFRHNTLAFAAEPNGPQWPNPPWSTFLFRKLLENSAFRTAFVNRYADFLNAYFDADAMNSVLDNVQALIASEMPDHIARWGGSYSGWLGQISNLRYFARNRGAAADAHVQAFFGLGSRQPITIDATGGGFVSVNRLRVDRFPWTGNYYPAVPLPLTANSYPGYRFTGWTGSVESGDRTISVNTLRALSLQANFEAADPQDYPLHINEIQYNAPADMDSDDWVELANRGSETIDLSGWSLSDGGGNTFVVPDGSRIQPEGYFVLVRNEPMFAASHPNVSPATGGWTFGLSNAGESVYLHDDAGFLVDSVAYSDLPPWPLEADGGGPTLELMDPLADNSLASSWRASTVRGGTPGAANSVTVGVDQSTPLPDEYILGTPFPNPFAGSTTLTYAVPRPGRTSIRVYDTLGRRVATLVDETAPAGYQSVVWDAKGLPSGVYLVRLSGSQGEVAAQSAVVVR